MQLVSLAHRNSKVPALISVKSEEDKHSGKAETRQISVGEAGETDEEVIVFVIISTDNYILVVN